MKYYECPICHKKFLAADLVETKCSENFVGYTVFSYCPSCINKKLPELVKLIEKRESIYFSSDGEDLGELEF